MFACEYITQKVPAKYHDSYPDKVLAGKQILELQEHDTITQDIEISDIDFYSILKRGILSAGKYEEVPPVITHSMYFFTETETDLQYVLDTIGDLSVVDEHFHGTGTTLRKFQVSEPLMKRILTMMIVGKKTSVSPVINTIQDLDSHVAYLNPSYPNDVIAFTEDCPFHWNECAVWDVMKPVWNEHLSKWPIQ